MVVVVDDNDSKVHVSAQTWFRSWAGRSGIGRRHGGLEIFEIFRSK
jgi:hypothetical protein